MADQDNKTAQDAAGEANSIKDLSELAHIFAGSAASGGRPQGGNLIRLLGMLAVCFLISLLVMAFMGSQPPAKPQENDDLLVIRAAAPHPLAAGQQPPGPFAGPPSGDPSENALTGAPQTQPAPSLQEPASWRKAEQAYLAGDFDQAAAEYRKLLKVAQAAQGDPLLTDFFGLRLGLCYNRIGRAGDAEYLLQIVSRSTSARIRAFTNYYQALRLARQGTHLQARMTAYQALAAASSLEGHLALEADCDFLIARVLTDKCLSFHGRETIVDWTEDKPADPFAGLDDKRLREALSEGLKPGKALLGPEITPLTPAGAVPQWQVLCVACPLSDLVERFAARANVEVAWRFPSSVPRQRAVDLALTHVTSQRMLEIAAGSIALLARYDGQQIFLHDPQSYESTSQNRDLLTGEAMAVWRRLFLRYPSDERVYNGRYAFACLQEFGGQTLAAIQEYQLIAQRFPNSPQAPKSLLRSAELRMNMKDYAGSQNDLMALLDRYPSQGSTRQVYLALGRAASLAGLWQEAYKAYHKIYYLDQSTTTRLEASLGAGRSLYQLARHKEAADWLKRYVQHGGQPASVADDTFLLLARCQATLGDLADAAAICRWVLEARTAPRDAASGGPPRHVLIETCLELARIESRRERFVWVLDAIRRLEGEELSPAQQAEMHTLAARAYSGMLLHEKAIDMLRSAVRTTDDPEPRSTLQVELARCQVEAGDLTSAQQTLADVLPKLKLEATYAVQCELADVLLRMEKPAQAVVVLQGLLKSACPAEVRGRATELLSLAYSARQEYHKAAVALLGGAEAGAGGGRK